MDTGASGVDDQTRITLLSVESRVLIDAECVDVDTGEVKVTALPIVLRAIALGSCVAVTAIDQAARIAGLAHVMLPGRCSNVSGHDHTRYAEDAIETLIDGLVSLGGNPGQLDVCLIGGANVLGEGDIPDKVLASVIDCLSQRGIVWRATHVGGTKRRSAYINNLTGMVLYTQGDSHLQLLWHSEQDTTEYTTSQVTQIRPLAK